MVIVANKLMNEKTIKRVYLLHFWKKKKEKKNVMLIWVFQIIFDIGKALIEMKIMD